MSHFGWQIVNETFFKFTDVFKECLTKLLDKKEKLKIGNRPIIKKAGKKTTQYKNGEFYVEENFFSLYCEIVDIFLKYLLVIFFCIFAKSFI